MNLIVYAPNHGYSDNQAVFVSWLDGVYYVDDPDTDSFKLTDGADGVSVGYTKTVTEGYVRQVDTSIATLTINGLDHLEGESVSLTAGQVDMGSYVVSGGSITVPDTVYTYQVGKPYTMKVKTMRFAVPGQGGLQTRIKKIGEQAARVVRAKGGQIGQEYNGREYITDMNAEYSDYSADVAALNKGGYDKDGYSVVKSGDPFPMTILGIIVDIEVIER